MLFGVEQRPSHPRRENSIERGVDRELRGTWRSVLYLDLLAIVLDYWDLVWKGLDFSNFGACPDWLYQGYQLRLIERL